MTTERLIVRRNEGKKDIPTAFIFSCPGQEELKSGKNDPIIPVLFENSDVLKDAGLNEMWIDE